MRVAFAGAGSFAVPLLETLAGMDVELMKVISRPDRPKGRGCRLAPTPVAEEAGELGLVLTKTGRIGTLEPDLRELSLDLLFVADFGEILPEKVLQLPRVGPFNVHASLLPRWRGAAPCAWAVRAGDTLSGVTIFRMVRGMDAGPVLCQREVPVLPDDTAGSLEERLSGEAAVLLVEAVGLLKSGSYNVREQDSRLVTLAPKLTKEDGRIPWTEAAEAVARHVRAMQPWPRAFSFLVRPDQAPQRILILQASAIPGSERTGEPGTVTKVTDTRLEIACGTGRLAVLRLQVAGRKAMSTGEFLRGCEVKAGDTLQIG